MPHIDGYADFLVEDVRVKLGYDAKDNSHDDEVLAKLTAGEKISKSKHLKSKSLEDGLREAVEQAKGEKAFKADIMSTNFSDGLVSMLVRKSMQVDKVEIVRDKRNGKDEVILKVNDEKFFQHDFNFKGNYRIENNIQIKEEIQ